ncbi:3-isopropylmalate dehydrogenase [Clostridium sp. MCC353]|uniref:3-isopropylmalate dehydrogenase n=1 Tax=Clostridium sp. MCC353 TaxID=2592646 RepID=UPI001C019F8F|nr:3-isopropylmalate dehydrogenase [Clostridium sp. MCC353]MBT9777496.1 3-isopropylmalate dehydrogenase [Clostridium sp. MCC353]
MDEKPLQWHVAFQAALQIELMEDREYLQFLKEYNLSEKPLQIDTLIIKLEPGRKIKKSLGRIFRQYNVVEYKSPLDYLSVNDFYKVMGYACFYQSNTEKVMEIRPDELTVTLISNHYPDKTIRYLTKNHGIAVTKAFPGIYYMEGLLFPIQIVVTKKLSREEHIWLSRLRNDLNMEEDIEPLARAYEGKQKNPLYAAVMDMIIRANKNLYEEGKNMCDALRELFADELEEGIRQAKEEWIQAMILDNLEEGVAADRICEKLHRRFNIPLEKASEYIDKYTAV